MVKGIGNGGGVLEKPNKTQQTKTIQIATLARPVHDSDKDKYYLSICLSRSPPTPRVRVPPKAA